MPELPEVETTRRGIAPHILGQTITDVIVRDRRLRWPVPTNLKKKLFNQQVVAVDRRAKYILIRFHQGCLILHLGMSGSLRILKSDIPASKHDHIDIVFASGIRLRFRDPRRFGSLHWTADEPLKHKLLRDVGPEPLADEFNGNHLFRLSRKRRQSVKTFIMDGRIVTGVGNIYASEALFRAGIRPGKAAGKVSKEQYERLAQAIKQTLADAITQGGTTLRDFVDAEGEPGYFRMRLNVYDRAGEPCRICKQHIKQIRQGQRSTYYCPKCQH